jgi:hypothetical protein
MTHAFGNKFLSFQVEDEDAPVVPQKQMVKKAPAQKAKVVVKK